jgi:hypothetical protein
MNLPKRHRPIVGLPVECERRYYANREAVPGDYDTASFRQNMEVPGGDHWLAELNLERWRNAAELAAYLRWTAASIEALAARKPNAAGELPGAKTQK